jgi:aspartyl-tRNA(Asn)/glutamyl-tRNA(Gln) amidotransferase subunit A
MSLFGGVDAILLPSVPCTAPPVGTLKATINGSEKEFLWLQRPFMHTASLTGFPAIALPMGISKEGLPLSLQMVGRPWEESTLLRIARAYEEATPEIRRLRLPCG